jgi:hypothetical protein
MNQRTINQHYVPQCLLKHFCKNIKNVERLNIFDIARSHIRYNQSIKENFSQNYFYDKDNSIESLLSQKVESPAAIVIDKIVSGQLDILDEDRPALLKFISALLFRTPEARAKALSFINSFFESMVEKLLSLNGFDPNEASKGWIQPKDPSDLVSLITLQGIIDSAILVDLDFHIIKNESSLEFCISDHPVFAYNWFYRNLDHPGVTGLTAKGLQFFLPISSNLLICLYDSEVYKYGKKNSALTIASSVDDIEILNSFQVINAESIIGFRDKNSETSMKELYRKYKNLKVYQHESNLIKEEKLEDGKLKTTHLTFTRQTKIPKMPSFISIKKNSRIHTSVFSERNPALAAFHHRYKEQMLEERRTVINL